jgi:hypothetical protein
MPIIPKETKLNMVLKLHLIFKSMAAISLFYEIAFRIFLDV